MVEAFHPSEYLAHVRRIGDEGWAVHALANHLQGTAALAGEFAAPFGNGDWAFLAGLWHDMGKYSPEFQARIRTKSGFDPDAHLEVEGGIERVDHSTAGALHAVARLGPTGQILAYLISGHHAGLPDWNRMPGGGGPLSERLANHDLLERAKAGGAPQSLLDARPPESRPIPRSPEHVHLWIRMLFSSLVDADFLDTEAFMDPARCAKRSSKICPEDLKQRLDTYLAEKAANAPDTPVNKVRKEVLSQCRIGARHPPGLFSLTVPTGGGKTLASMAFALEHAIRHGKRRVIVVIPYTSIIEQTAEALRGAFGDPNAILEHHSNLDPDRETVAGRLSAENWDAPVIVTTNVQFFESLFAARTSVCRKLHNLTDSVVIFDEVQMLPPEYLRPILGAIKGLTEDFGVTALLCTATQPALQGRIGSQQATIQGLDGVKELITDPSGLASELRRVSLRTLGSASKRVAWHDLAAELQQHGQVLCIVNTRKDCQSLHKLMPKGTIHLSAVMCAEHRSRTISEIKRHLKHGDPIRVISTQLVEAGVDLDFPVVYRAMAGLDSIAQAAGRCNREGRLGEVGHLGEVVVFYPPTQAPPGLLRKGEEACQELFRSDPLRVAALEPAAFKRYFQCFYAKVNTFDGKGMKSLLEQSASSGQFQFRTAAREFRLIEDEAQQAVVVWDCPFKHKIQEHLASLEAIGPNRELLRKLQRFTVSIRERDFKALADRGEIRDYGGIWGQAVDGLYDPELGLLTDGAGWNPDGMIL